MNSPMYPAAAPYNDGSAGVDTATQPEKKATRKLVTGNRLIALLCAVAAGGLLLLFTGGDDGPPPPSLYVIRTTEAVPALTTISADQLEAVALPEQAIEPGTFQGDDPIALVADTAETLADKTTLNPLNVAEQIRESDFSAELVLGTTAEPDERYVSITAGVDKAVAGLVRPGDYVDVVASLGGITNIVAERLEIIAVRPGAGVYGSIASEQQKNLAVEIEDRIPGRPVPYQYILRVDAQTAVDLTAVIGSADQITLLLYGGGSEKTATVPADFAVLLCGGDELCLELMEPGRVVSSEQGENEQTVPIP